MKNLRKKILATLLISAAITATMPVQACKSNWLTTCDNVDAKNDGKQAYHKTMNDGTYCYRYSKHFKDTTVCNKKSGGCSKVTKDSHLHKYMHTKCGSVDVKCPYK